MVNHQHKDGEDIDQVFKRYRQQMYISDIIKELHKHQEYIKPSQKKRKHLRQARYKQCMKDYIS
ncbi:30S ribosomal protein S21 [Candidatus Karelsulcia muelleri]